MRFNRQVMRLPHQLRGFAMCFSFDDRGQSSIEAAFMLPILFLLLLLLIQPGIWLYDRMVMGAAATEACRLLCTLSVQEVGEGYCEDYIRRRLGSLPPHECFHRHEPECSWKIELSGNESSEEVSVRIGNELMPLPILGFGAKVLGITNAQGNLEISVEARAFTQPDWARTGSMGVSPSQWPGLWISSPEGAAEDHH